jgi:hypothetical protein|uniref:Uncharacterized protein n=1 Tax=viral metagenome TaxID=1070528 RepID=A0A6C0JPP8_9ZZZZ
MYQLGFDLQNDASKIFNDKDKYINIPISDSISQLEYDLKFLNKVYNILFDIYMDLIYYGKHKSYYDNFAVTYNETELLIDSGYVLFDLDDLYVSTIDGKAKRNWLYDSEIISMKDSVVKQKNKIKDRINEINVKVGISIALLR